LPLPGKEQLITEKEKLVNINLVADDHKYALQKPQLHAGDRKEITSILFR